MKTKIFSLLLAGSCLGFTACGDYLKDDSGDLMIPSSVSEFQPLLYGEAYPSDYDAATEAGWINLSTDDVELGFLTGSTDLKYESSVETGKSAFLWDSDIDSHITDKFWTARYKNILACNLTIDALPTMIYSENETGKYHYIAAQAYTLRAYNYFCLINTYALPYSEANRDKPGVILRLESAITEATLKMPRTTIGQVYDQIVEDLEAASDHMALSDFSTNKHLISPAALKLLTTRVALYMGDWDAAIAAGGEFFRENSYIFDLNGVDIGLMGGTPQNDYPFVMFVLDSNKEIIFTFGNRTSSYPYMARGGLGRYGYRTSWSKNSSLIQAYKQQFDPIDEAGGNMSPKWLYDDADDTDYFVEVDSEADADVYDLRLRAYFEKNHTTGAETSYSMYYPMKYKAGGANVMQSFKECWRTVEVYLNVAEAHARKSSGIDATALNLINKLRQNRLRTDMYEELTADHFASKDDFVKFIWQERRRELCNEENHRFWDLRRQGMPRLYHKWIDITGDETMYVLEQGGNNYVMAIPRSEWTANDLAVSNKRDVINPN